MQLVNSFLHLGNKLQSSSLTMKISSKFVLSLFILLMANYSYSQDTIHWRPDYKLKWEDFQGAADTTSEYKAISSPAISYNLLSSEKKFSVKVSCYFYKSKSWTKSRSDNLLAHEQGHFDIAELFARKLRERFSIYKYNASSIRNDFREIYNKILDEKDKMDSLYDKETNFSRNKTNQIYWTKKIAQELKRMNKFKE
jgi:hypothetical protein